MASGGNTATDASARSVTDGHSVNSLRRRLPPMIETRQKGGRKSWRQRYILPQTGRSQTRTIRLCGYPPSIVPPSNPDQMTYGTAFVDGIDIATNAQGMVSQIANTNMGSFPPQALADLSASGQDMLVSSMALTTLSRTLSPAPRSTGMVGCFRRTGYQYNGHCILLALAWHSGLRRQYSKATI